MNLFQIYDRLYVYLKQKGISFTEDGYPIFRENMFTYEIPEEILPFNRRGECKNKTKTALCTCQVDREVYPRIKHLDQDLEEWKSYMACIVFDLSPRIEWRTEIQKFNICLNKMAAIYLALHGVKLIGNLRVGSISTFPALLSYPKKIPFLVGSLGCTKNCTKEDLLFLEMKMIISQPSFVYVYGVFSDELKYLLESYNIAYKVFKSRREISFSKNKEVA